MSSSIQDILAELRVSYIAAMPDKITAINALWKSNELKLLKTEFHKLKGTGRTYGLPEITQVGEAMERLCEGPLDVLNQTVPLSLRLLERIRTQRTNGEIPDLDKEGDFQVIAYNVTAMPPKS